MGSGESKPEQPTPQPPPNPELQKPWRNFDWRQKDTLKEKLENFSPSNPNVKNIKILVAGEIGAGKSSFINSVYSAFQGRICARAPANSTATDGSFTKNLKSFIIRSGRKTLPIIFNDIMGLEGGLMAGSQAEDIVSAVLGHVKDGYKFNEKQPLSYKDQHYTCDPELSDQCFCLVYVIPADVVQYTNDRLIEKLKLIRYRMTEKGIPQVIVMTKVDEACPLVQKDLWKVYTSKKIKEKIDLCSATIGVPLSNIFPVKNYHNEIDTDDITDVLILKALEQIVNVADDRLIDG